MTSQEGETTTRRSLFPKSYSKKESKKGRNVSFSPYARCLKLEAQNLTDEDKSRMWWQKPDYEEFARVGRIISKAMLEGGSEIWLRSNSLLSSSGKPVDNGEEITRVSGPKTTKDDCMIETSSSSSDGANPPLHHDFNSENNSNEFCEIRNKWWHKFGHSRRGLEHIASNAEGRQRHSNCRSAIRSVIEEQQRQMMFLPKGYADVDKIRTAYLRQTHWARILARAAGESDTDAVRTNFDDARRKPREFYLKKHFDNNRDCILTNNEIRLPVFMEATMSTRRTIKILNLDAHTESQICFRESQVLSASSRLQKNNDDGDEGQETTKCSNNDASREFSSLCEEERAQIDHSRRSGDANNSDDLPMSPSRASPKSSLAKMAAGWGVEDAQEDMSSVLIGMGISANHNITVG